MQPAMRPEPADAGPSAYDLADWRRRVFDLYSTVREMPDPKAAWELWRSTRTALFQSHPMSPLPENDRAKAEIPIFSYDEGLRIAVALDPADGPALTYNLGDDGTLSVRPIAKTRGLAQVLGGELTLYWIDGYGGGLFLPFTDATSGTETYGGGRYLFDGIKGADLGLDADGRVICDFNFAYSPSCAWSPRYVCPLAPQENRLPKPVRAGERHPA